MPGPSSSTVSVPSASRIDDRAVGRAPLGGVVEQVGDRPLQRRRRRRSTHHGSTSTSNVDAGRAAADPGERPVDDVGEVDLLHHGRAAARRGRARPGRRSAWSAPRSGRGRRRAARPGPPRAASWPAWASRSRLVRSEVSGVRSSWPASATSWRCRSREAASAASIWLKAVASRAISSSPSTGSGRRSSVRAISSTARRQPAHRPQPVAGDRPAGQRRRRPRRRRPNSSITTPSLASVCSLRLERLGEHQRLARRPRRHGDHAVLLAVVGRRSVRTLWPRLPPATSSSGGAELQRRSRGRR